MAGSVFIVRNVDLAADVDQPPITTNSSPSTATDAPANRARTSILLVEDDEAVLDTFARMLRLEGLEVRTAVTPEDGLQQAEHSRPDAIILDFRMPLLDGLEFLRRLRSFPDQRDTPVAIVTGDYFLDDEVTRELNELGATVLFKPLWLEQLVDLARRLLKLPHVPQQQSA